MVDTFEISVTLAATLLLRKGDVSISDIRSLPFVSDQQEAIAIAGRLTDAFGPRCKIETLDNQAGANVRLRMSIHDSQKELIAMSTARATDLKA